MKKLVDGVLMDMDQSEEAAHLAADVPFFADQPVAPTKEQLMAQLAALSAQIQALE